MHVLTLVLVARLYDSFGVPAGDLRSATEVAAHTLQQAGIGITWTACSPAVQPAMGLSSRQCDHVPLDGELTIRFVQATGRTPENRALGYAFVDRSIGQGSLATILVDRVKKLAKQGDLDQGTILGRAIAHEIGHLLLGTTGHARRGLMRAQWTVEELRQSFGTDWRFSNSEAAAMRARIEARRAGQRLEPAPPATSRGL